jgi:4-diphosphocytidyl-2-C-methyl-D-erythritol kinase
VNDFQAPLTALHPEITVALAALASLGADLTSLSGSGSACFGVFESAGAAATAGSALRDAGCEVWVEVPGATSDER